MRKIIVLPTQRGVDIDRCVNVFKQLTQQDTLRAVALIGIERDMTTYHVASGRHGEKIMLIGALKAVCHQLLNEDIEVSQ